ncbi:hypothetical protein ABTZ59_24790 [Streptomyces sp. NPDC094034]|uniref:hypothetical protein n=1 Tax=Streptomyces sp. NPDC094034 TaxID=3155309 RepID=UPI003327B247
MAGEWGVLVVTVFHDLWDYARLVRRRRAVARYRRAVLAELVSKAAQLRRLEERAIKDQLARLDDSAFFARNFECPPSRKSGDSE